METPKDTVYADVVILLDGDQLSGSVTRRTYQRALGPAPRKVTAKTRPGAVEQPRSDGPMIINEVPNTMFQSDSWIDELEADIVSTASMPGKHRTSSRTLSGSGGQLSFVLGGTFQPPSIEWMREFVRAAQEEPLPKQNELPLDFLWHLVKTCRMASLVFLVSSAIMYLAAIDTLLYFFLGGGVLHPIASIVLCQTAAALSLTSIVSIWTTTRRFLKSAESALQDKGM